MIHAVCNDAGVPGIRKIFTEEIFFLVADEDGLAEGSVDFFFKRQESDSFFSVNVL